MIVVRIAALSVDATSNQPVIILRPLDEEGSSARLLPIWIGHSEAASILIALQNIESPRPMTHDLLHNIITTLGQTVDRVEITRLDGGTFYASVILASEGTSLTVDARPSDSIALAVRTGSPIYVAEEVFTEASIIADQLQEMDEEAQVEEFRAFLDDVDPSDFQG